MNPRRPCRVLVPLLTLALGACSALPITPATPTPIPPTATAVPPTATPIPLAAVINGQPLRRSDFEAEVARYEAAQRKAGIELATQPEYREQVLWALIDMELLAGAAVASGQEISEAELDDLLQTLTEERGGTEPMAAWLAANGYEVPSLKRALRREMLAQMTVERLADEVPSKMEQVHARHILVASAAQAEDLRIELEVGADFGELAVQNSLDPSTKVAGGDLGWFPRGILSQPVIEEVAFALEVSEISQVVKSELGYHVVQVIERGIQPLTPNDLRRLRTLAVESWLEQARQTANIDILIAP